MTTIDRAARTRVPRDPVDDYTREAAEARRAFVEEQTGVGLEHVSHFSLDPASMAGNVEHFIGRRAGADRRRRARCWSTASTPRASSTCRSPRPRARSSRATTAA